MVYFNIYFGMFLLKHFCFKKENLTMFCITWDSMISTPLKIESDKIHSKTFVFSLEQMIGYLNI